MHIPFLLERRNAPDTGVTECSTQCDADLIGAVAQVSVSSPTFCSLDLFWTEIVQI